MAPAVNSRSQWDGELRPSMPPRLRIALGLLAMLPVAAAADWFHWGDWFVFIASILSIIPLAILLSTASLLCFVRVWRAHRAAQEVPWPWLISWMLINGAGVACHYFFVMGLLMQALATAVLMRSNRRCWLALAASS